MLPDNQQSYRVIEGCLTDAMSYVNTASRQAELLIYTFLNQCRHYIGRALKKIGFCPYTTKQSIQVKAYQTATKGNFLFVD